MLDFLNFLKTWKHEKPLYINLCFLAENCLNYPHVWAQCGSAASISGNKVNLVWASAQFCSLRLVPLLKHLRVNNPTTACIWLLRECLEDACGASAKMAFEKLGYWSDNDFPVFVCKFLGQLNIHFCGSTLSALTCFLPISFPDSHSP